MKKLLITSTDMMMIQFLIPHVCHLSRSCFRVEIACSEVGARMDDVREALKDSVDAIHTVRLERSPVSPRNLLGYRDMCRLLQENQYDIIWTNEPVMGVVTRLAARNAGKSGTKVVYMCHGFHFFKGAGPLNWLIFYPVERFMSRFCDAIVTMNREDFQRANTFHAPAVYQIPGVGVDAARFQTKASPEMRQAKRQELGIPEDACLLLSVGELTKRKNHETALRAMKELDAPTVHYVICGVGDLQPYLERLCRELGLSDRVHFLGYRMDISEIMHCADCFVFPSRQEGLPFALMEAMSCGLPIVCSRIRGNVDLIDDPQGGILCDTFDSHAFCEALRSLPTRDTAAMADYNAKKLPRFCLEYTKVVLSDLLDSLISKNIEEIA